MTTDAPPRPTLGPASSLFGELAADHHAIRDMVDRLEHARDAGVVDLADGLSNLLARHRSTAMQSVITLTRASQGDHEQQVRLLLSAMRGIDQLTDRLRLPARDPLLVDNLLIAMRGLNYEHERLETELLAAELR